MTARDMKTGALGAGLLLAAGALLASSCKGADQAPAPSPAPEARAAAADPGAVTATAAAKAAAVEQDQLARAWAEASRDVTNLAYAIEDRLDAISEAKKLPPGLDPAAVVWARASLASLQTSWTEVPEQFERGDKAQAVARAKELAARGGEILGRIGAR